jgi:hypothetical protein
MRQNEFASQQPELMVCMCYFPYPLLRVVILLKEGLLLLLAVHFYHPTGGYFCLSFSRS